MFRKKLHGIKWCKWLSIESERKSINLDIEVVISILKNSTSVNNFFNPLVNDSSYFMMQLHHFDMKNSYPEANRATDALVIGAKDTIGSWICCSSQFSCWTNFISLLDFVAKDLYCVSVNLYWLILKLITT